MRDLLVVHDAHPEYASTQYARSLGAELLAVQHHRAHVASVLTEREAFEQRVIGIAFDGTGYGDDGTIWGGEIFTGSLRGGFERAIWLREASFAGRRRRSPSSRASRRRLFEPSSTTSPILPATPFLFPRALHKSDGACSQRRAYVYDDVGWAFVRHRRGAAGIHACHYV